MRYYGNIAFRFTEETVPGIYEEKFVIRPYYGEVLRNYRTLHTESKEINDDISLRNQISIVADQFAYNHFQSMIYVEFMGTKWKAQDVEVVMPRLQITLGGEYNGDTGSQA